MKTTIEYLDEIAKKYPRRNGAPASDYGLADLLEVSAQSVSKYRKGHSRFDEPVALRVAELLDIDPAIVLLNTAAARSNCPEAKQVWERIARRVSSGVLMVFVSIFAVFFADMPTAHASAGQIIAQTASPLQAIAVCILCQIQKAWSRVRAKTSRLINGLLPPIACPA